MNISTSLEVARRRERLRDAAHEVLGPVPGSKGTLSITAGPGREKKQLLPLLMSGIKGKAGNTNEFTETKENSPPTLLGPLALLTMLVAWRSVSSAGLFL